MKTFAFVLLSLLLSVTATPLGDRAVFRRHNGTPLSRRYILQSRQDAPAACAALPSNTTAVPDPTATDLPSVDPSTTDNSTDTTDPSLTPSNTTIADPTATGNSTAISNSTAITNSTATTNSTVSRRFWARHGGFQGFSGGFSETTFEHTSVSVSVSFEEEVSTFVSSWDDLCLNSGGDIFTNDPCVNLGGSFGIDALLETADPCDQQHIADSIITFAKSDGITNRDDLINYGISFRKHARRAVEILGVVPSSLFCLEAPINPEIVGVYNDQCDGVNPGIFGSPNSPLVPFGSSGTCPYEMDADVDSCGCVSSDGTDDSGDDSSDSSDSTDSTDDSSDSTDSGDDSSDSSDSTDDSSDSSDSTDDSSDSSDSTDSSDASSTDSTDASSTDTADASATTSDATVTPPPDPTGPEPQPTDISGNVNDPSGRRK